MYWDDFDCEVQCEEYYSDNEIDYADAEVEDVSVNDIPLDGHYLEHLIDSIDE